MYSIKFALILTMALLSSFTCGAGAQAAMSGDECRRLLLVASSGKLDTLDVDDLDEHLEVAEIIQGHGDPEDGRFYREALKLVPLFNSYIIHKAVAEELRAEGRTKPVQIQNSLTIFQNLDDDSQLNFTEKVFSRLLYSIQDRISNNAADTAKLEMKATQFKMSFEKYLEFVKAWKSQEESGYVAVKLALLMNLRRHENNFVSNVSAQARLWRRIIHSFEKDKTVNPLVPSVGTHNVYTLLTQPEKTPFSHEDFNNFMSRVSKGGLDLFLEQNLLLLNQKQVAAALKTDVKAEVAELLRQRQQLLLDAGAEIKSVEDRHAQMTSTHATLKHELEILKSPMPPDITPLSLQEEVLVTSLAEDVKRRNFDHEKTAAMKGLLESYAPRLTSAQFKRLIIDHLAPVVGRYNFEQDKIAAFGVWLAAARHVILYQSDLVEIKSRMIAIAQLFRFANQKQEGLNLANSLVCLHPQYARTLSKADFQRIYDLQAALGKFQATLSAGDRDLQVVEEKYSLIR